MRSRAGHVGRTREDFRSRNGLRRIMGPSMASTACAPVSKTATAQPTLDRIELTGNRIQRSAHLQPTVDYTERVAAVFELTR